MRTVPDEGGREDWERLNGEPWMLDALALNPSYVFWGPHEDYQSDPKSGWRAPILFDRWEDQTVSLNDLNEVVNFYFFVRRDSETCSSCGGSGYNPETDQIAEDFYDFANTGRRWVDAITQDECDALVASNRLREYSDGTWRSVPRTAGDVNAGNVRGSLFGGLQHDAINRMILIEARAKRLGVWGHCATCEGHGDVYTEPSARLGVTIWLIHPRKGCGRGVEVRHVTQDELPKVCEFLREAAQRNADRFASISLASPAPEGGGS